MVMTLVSGMAVIGCTDKSGLDSLNGTWVNNSDGDRFKFDNGSFIWSEEDGTNIEKGTYSTSGSNVTLMATDIWGSHLSIGKRWFSKAELKAELRPMFPGEDIDRAVEELFSPITGTVNGNRITLSQSGSDTFVYTKR